MIVLEKVLENIVNLLFCKLPVCIKCKQQNMEVMSVALLSSHSNAGGCCHRSSWTPGVLVFEFLSRMFCHLFL